MHAAINELTEDNSSLRNYKVKLSSIVTYNVPLTEEQQRTFKIKRAKCGDFSITIIVFLFFSLHMLNKYLALYYSKHVNYTLYSLLFFAYKVSFI